MWARCAGDNNSRVGIAQALISSLFHLLPVVTETDKLIVPHLTHADPGVIPLNSRKKRGRIELLPCFLPLTGSTWLPTHCRQDREPNLNKEIFHKPLVRFQPSIVSIFPED